MGKNSKNVSYIDHMYKEGTVSRQGVEGKEKGEEMRMGPLPDCDDFSAGWFAPPRRAWGCVLSCPLAGIFFREAGWSLAGNSEIAY